MKRFLLLIFLLLLFNVSAYASADETQSVKLKGNKFVLMYSKKSPELGSYINEYYKKNETYNNWTELLAVHHFPSAFYPIDQAKDFGQYLKMLNVPPIEVTTDEEKNVATIDFIVSNDKTRPIIVEYNIFRYQKDTICGTIGLQYARRYAIPSPLEYDKLKRKILKDRKKYMSDFNKLKMPELILADIDNGKYVQPETPKKEDIQKQSVKVESETEKQTETKDADTPKDK